VPSLLPGSRQRTEAGQPDSGRHGWAYLKASAARADTAQALADRPTCRETPACWLVELTSLSEFRTGRDGHGGGFAVRRDHEERSVRWSSGLPGCCLMAGGSATGELEPSRPQNGSISRSPVTRYRHSAAARSAEAARSLRLLRPRCS